MEMHKMCISMLNMADASIDPLAVAAAVGYHMRVREHRIEHSIAACHVRCLRSSPSRVNRSHNVATWSIADPSGLHREKPVWTARGNLQAVRVEYGVSPGPGSCTGTQDAVQARGKMQCRPLQSPKSTSQFGITNITMQRQALTEHRGGLQ